MSKSALTRFDLASGTFRSSKNIKPEIKIQLREEFDDLLNSKIAGLEERLEELKTIRALIDEKKCFLLYNDIAYNSYFYLDSNDEEYEYSNLFDRNFLVNRDMQMYEITDAINCEELYPHKYDDNRTKVTKVVTAKRIKEA